jgi:spore coat polysaccharide biosynthesis protein SpsF
VEAFTIQTLALADKLSRSSGEREHVTLQIYQNASLYRIGSVQPREDYSNLRWTVDTAEDLKLVNLIFKHFGHQRFRWRQIIDAYSSNPHWAVINQQISQKQVA